MNYVIATIKSWNIKNFKTLQKNDKVNKWFLIDKPEDLSFKKLNIIKPRYIFFPHWSWIIPSEIYDNFECIVFHMTDLPYGRGGSPLQNLIVRGKIKTKISAIKVVGELDAGPIYLKKDLSLEGNAEDIFKRFSKITFLAMKDMVTKEIMPKPQKGEPVIFKRRKPQESDISNLNKVREIYDYIRMLDGEGYPVAFLEKNELRFEFTKAKMSNNEISALVKIKIKK